MGILGIGGHDRVAGTGEESQVSVGDVACRGGAQEEPDVSRPPR